MAAAGVKRSMSLLGYLEVKYTPSRIKTAFDVAGQIRVENKIKPRINTKIQ
jgi:hypothetical protein